MSYRVTRFCLAISVMCCVSYGPVSAQSPQQPLNAEAKIQTFFANVSTLAHPDMNVQSEHEKVQRGQALFNKVWEPGESLYPEADGIGPLFNETSCIACHSQAGVGGGSGVEKNVDILSLDSRATSKEQMLLSRFHPGFRNPAGSFLNNIVLHRFDIDQKAFPTAYSKERTKLMGNVVSSDASEMDLSKLQRNLETEPIREVTTPMGIKLAHSQRNSTALFGAGKIDKIPDIVIAAEAVRQAKRGKVSGRTCQIIENPIGNLRLRVGKFGWRAQQTTLHDFVEGACAMELGLNTITQKQTRHPRQDALDDSRGIDLQPDDVIALSKFVASIPEPVAVVNDAATHELATLGRAAFEEVGCAECHTPRLGDAKGIYSDLLLHDMGESLADPAPARDAIELKPRAFGKLLIAQETGNRELLGDILVNSEGLSSSTSYYGFDIVTETPVIPLEIRQREWRTPPLWGVADSAPYMHDGRARTLIEAIGYHDGEALFSKKKFLRLPTEERHALLVFLKTLRAPEAK